MEIKANDVMAVCFYNPSGQSHSALFIEDTVDTCYLIDE